MEEKYFDKKNVSIKLINKSIANNIIVKHHYTHTATNCIISFGIFNNEDGKFFNKQRLIGVITYGSPVGRNVVQSISPILRNNEVLELTRLFIFDGYGGNIESYFIGNTIRLLKKLLPKTKVIISYSDPEQNHVGTIYKASNFKYQGDTMRLVDGYWYLFPDDISWMHPRSVVGKFGSSTPTTLLNKHTEYKVKEIKRKHRYIYLICNRIERKKIITTLKYPFLPYPKKIENHIDEIYIVRKNNDGDIEYIQEKEKKED